MRQLINVLVYIHCNSGIFVQVKTKSMRFLFPWLELCPSNFFLRNSWNCIAWRLNILMNTVRLEHKSFRPIFGLLLSIAVDIVSLLFSPMQSFDISTKTKLEISIVTLSLLQHWPFYFYGNEDNTHVYCPISSINIVLAVLQEIIFISTSSIECKW